tara:strand:+ start:888 stop:1127 length:240 start_codon:yes stop_codon:yes gene_type:complete
MIHYKDLTDLQIYAYDETDTTQEPYIQQAIDNGWESITDEALKEIQDEYEANLPKPTPLTAVELMAQLRIIQAKIEALV